MYNTTYTILRYKPATDVNLQTCQKYNTTAAIPISKYKSNHVKYNL